MMKTKIKGDVEMKKYDWDKLFTLGEDRAKHFRWVAEPVVKATTVGEDLEKVSYLSAIDMAIGEEVTKGKHIRNGIGIGLAIGVGTTAFICGFVSKKKETEG
jgi:hypothetical protein